MKTITGLLFLFAFYNSTAQCPYVSGVLADASNAGTPTGEGKNEFLVFNTGTTSVNVNSVFLSYGTTTTSTSFSVNGAAVPSVWTNPATSGLLTNSAGTISIVLSGLIPANKNVVVISKDNAINYDLQTFGSDVYVLFFDQTLAGVSSFAAAGNYPNTGALARYLRISQGATCRDTVSYIPDNLPGADGGGAKWNSSKVITYVNSGSSGAVLPIHLLSFNASVHSGRVKIDWSTAVASTAQHFELEKSSDAIVFSQVAVLPAQKESMESVKKYSFTDVLSANETVFYRMRIIDIDGTSSFSPTNKINAYGSVNTGSVYPNPAVNELFILNSGNFEEVKIFDSYGKSWIDKVLVIGKNGIDISSLSPGFYLLQLKSKNGIEYHKIAKE